MPNKKITNISLSCPCCGASLTIRSPPAKGDFPRGAKHRPQNARTSIASTRYCASRQPAGKHCSKQSAADEKSKPELLEKKFCGGAQEEQGPAGRKNPLGISISIRRPPKFHQECPLLWQSRTGKPRRAERGIIRQPDPCGGDMPGSRPRDRLLLRQGFRIFPDARGRRSATAGGPVQSHGSLGFPPERGEPQVHAQSQSGGF